MSPPQGDMSIVAAVARLEARMDYIAAELADVKTKLETLNKARWLGSGFLLALGGGGVYALQKIAAILPALGR